MINVFQPSLGGDELTALEGVFKSNWLGKGKKVAQFESEFAKHCFVAPETMLSTTCATEGLFSVLEFVNLKNDDEVIVPSISFVAAGSTVCNAKAKLVICDVDPRTLNATLKDIEKVTTPRTKMVLLNHYGGYPAEADKISAFCKERGIILFEDAACAPGSRINGIAAGTFGDFGVWSFDAMKVLVTGDGSMIYVADPDQRKKLQEKMYLGLMESSTSGLEKSKSSKDKWWEYQISSYGRRAIMNDVTAAIGLVQIAKLQSYFSKRAEIAKIYSGELKDIDGLQLIPPVPQNYEVGHYLYWIQTEFRDDLANYLLNKGVYTTFRYWPLHRVDAFKHGVMHPLKNAEQAAATTINIPCHQSLTDTDLDKIISSIKDFFKQR